MVGGVVGDVQEEHPERRAKCLAPRVPVLDDPAEAGIALSVDEGLQLGLQGIPPTPQLSHRGHIGERQAGGRHALEALQLCLELGNVNAVNAAGLTALHGAAFRGWNAGVQTLVNRGARLDAKDKQGRTPMNWADGVYRGGGIAPVRQLQTIALLEQLMK